MADNHYAAYIRKSTDKQSDQHQRQDIKDWLDSEGIEVSEVDIYAETGSGASERDQFSDLITEIENETYTDIVVWEVSRIARKGFLAQKFFDAAEDNGVTIHVTDGSVRRIDPDGHGRLVADVIASVAAEERRNLIRRTRSGQKQARKAGKWIGNSPVGFVVVDGFLKPNLDPDYDEGETGFLDIVEALEAVEAGQSYNNTAENTPNVTRQTLSKIDNDPERRKWYISGEAEDERVQEAIDSVNGSYDEVKLFNSEEPILADDYFDHFADYEHTPDTIDEVDSFPYRIQYPLNVEIEVEWFAEKLLAFVHGSYRYTVYYAPKDTQQDDDWIARRMSTEQGVRAVQEQDYDSVSNRYGSVEEALDALRELVSFEFDWK